jgi:type IV pilus assembly protein PilM
MPSGNAVWGIDLGQCALKAIKLRPMGDGKVEAVAFDLIEHPKILSQPDAEPDELIKAALDKFVERNDWQGDHFVIGVPGQQTFARFVKLPPVDPKKIPDMVRFEATQQIPFDMDDVVWDYQVFAAPDSPEVEVGIFAIRKDLIRKRLEFFSHVGIAPIAVQTMPSALYNFARFDQPGAGEAGATVLIDVGAQNTDLVICEANSTWTRNIPLGGNSFTEALVKAFKLSFAKAESLKRTAATSKYARQIFQAMRPVFAELVAEIQRSIGFYSSTHREVELKRVLALGNAFRLPGLQKYLENNLTISGGVVKLESFASVVANATSNAPQFTENVLSFGAAYGLALQGLGLAAVGANLLPGELARIALWHKKRPYFVAAAACLGLAAVFPITRNFVLDKTALASNGDYREKTTQIVKQAKTFQDRYREVQTNTGTKEADVKKLLDLQKDKLIVPRIIALVHEALPPIDEQIAKVQGREQLKKLIESDKAKYARVNRRQILIDGCRVQFQKNIDAFQPNEGMFTQATETPWGGAGGAAVGPGAIAIEGGSVRGRGPRSAPGGFDVPSQTQQPSDSKSETAEAPGFYVTLEGRLLFGDKQADANQFMEKVVLANLRQLAQRASLGFYLSDDDPSSPDESKRNLRLFSVKECFPQLKERFGQPIIQPPGGGTAEKPKGPEDPVTGEDMTNDWRFQIGLKLKLGEKPAAKTEPPAEKK